MPAPVITVSQMRDWENASWSAGAIDSDVIERVGQIVAQRARQMLGAEDFVLILAGKGNNGNDTRRAREHLDDFRVELCEVKDPGQALPEIIRMLEQQPALIIDGLFGIGLNRPLDEHWQTLIKRVNQSPAKILSVDVPSGLNADTGEPQGAAIRAFVTLTLGAPKKGMLIPAAWTFVGRLEVAPDIGLIKCPDFREVELNWTLAEDFKYFPPPRKNDANKGNFGRLAIIAGSHGFHGAAVLTARGAQRAQPGLITLHTQAEVYQPVASQLQAVMVSVWQPELKLPGNYDAILIGPGLAAPNLPVELKLAVRQVWLDSPVPVIVDASALDWLPHGPLPENALRVITPHPGEAARLLQISAAQVQADRPKALREISQRLGNCWVILKGAQTLIGRGTGPLSVNSSGNPHLAQGGSGDLLSGYLAGLLAQPALRENPSQTLSYAVWQHGAAADRLQAKRRNWVVEDLAQEIGGLPT